MKMSARYPGRCEKCGDPINPGDIIEWSPRIHICHETCPEVSTAESSDKVSGDAENNVKGEAKAEGPVIRVKIVVFMVLTDEEGRGY